LPIARPVPVAQEACERAAPRTCGPPFSAEKTDRNQTCDTATDLRWRVFRGWDAQAGPAGVCAVSRHRSQSSTAMTKLTRGRTQRLFHCRSQQVSCQLSAVSYQQSATN
jgi:hypothetical protein